MNALPGPGWQVNEDGDRERLRGFRYRVEIQRERERETVGSCFYRSMRPEGEGARKRARERAKLSLTYTVLLKYSLACFHYSQHYSAIEIAPSETHTHAEHAH